MNWLFFAILQLSVYGPSVETPRHPILSSADYQIWVDDNLGGPAATSTLIDPDQWTSYNQWRCFTTDRLQMRCETYGRREPVLSIEVERDNKYYFFDLDEEDEISCKGDLPRWRKLLKGSPEICVFADQIPSTTDGDGSMAIETWHLERFKTTNGSWYLPDGFYENADGAIVGKSTLLTD